MNASNLNDDTDTVGDLRKATDHERWLYDRRRKRWEQVCAADGIGACSKELGQIARHRGVLDKHTCLTRGGPPSWMPATSY
jgi:hypothetical protein